VGVSSTAFEGQETSERSRPSQKKTPRRRYSTGVGGWKDQSDTDNPFQNSARSTSTSFTERDGIRQHSTRELARHPNAWGHADSLARFVTESTESSSPPHSDATDNRERLSRARSKPAVGPSERSGLGYAVVTWGRGGKRCDSSSESTPAGSPPMKSPPSTSDAPGAVGRVGAIERCMVVSKDLQANALH